MIKQSIKGWEWTVRVGVGDRAGENNEGEGGTTVTEQ